jgi:20S proteasome subunit beta 2
MLQADVPDGWPMLLSKTRGSALYLQVYPHGSTDSLPYCTMGSGSLNAMAVFEDGYKEDLTKEEGMDLVTRAIRSGIFNDLGSGSNVDLCIITKDGVRSSLAA